MGMAYNFVAGDRDQLLLMPPSLAEWLPADHLAWFVLDVVGELDVSAFVAVYRADGRGGAAYEPSMMVALLVYAYCVGERSSRVIERRCSEDVAFRVIAANQLPDHATIARFRATHQDALAGLFGQVLGLCARAGMVKAGLVAVDGTRMEANASRAANRSAEQLAKEILDDAATVDAEEDARLGGARGDELPAELTGSGRRARIRALLDELEADAAKRSLATQLARRAEIEAATGRRLPGRKPKADAQHRRPRQLANVTDPDSRLMRVPGGFVQAYNAQAVATVDQVIVAAAVTNDGSDDAQFVPMVAATKKNLRAAGVRTRVRIVLADAGYWAKNNVDTPGVEALIAPGRTADLKQRPSNASPTSRGALPRGTAARSPSTMPPPSWASVDPASINSYWPANAHCHPPPRSRWPRSSRPRAVDGSTRSEARRSSPSSARPNTTAASDASPVAACPP